MSVSGVIARFPTGATIFTEFVVPYTATSAMLNSPIRRRQPRDGRAAEPPRSRISPWAVWLMGVPFVMVPLFVGLYLLGHNPIRPLMQALENEEKLELQIEELEQENTDLQQDVNALGPGQFGIEKRARERLGWSKPGEIVIHVPDKK